MQCLLKLFLCKNRLSDSNRRQCLQEKVKCTFQTSKSAIKYIYVYVYAYVYVYVHVHVHVHVYVCICVCMCVCLCVCVCVCVLTSYYLHFVLN